jgi:hypothetical protein
MSGNVAPVTLNPIPATVAALIVTAAAPFEVIVNDCVAGLFTFTFPNVILVALTCIVMTDAPSCRLVALEMPPALAVSVTDCATLTAEAVAEKLALIAPAATVTVDGTATAALLLPN